MVNPVEAFFDVRFQNVLGFQTDVVEDGFDGVLGTTPWPEPVTVGFKTGFPFWFERQFDQVILASLAREGVFDTRNAAEANRWTDCLARIETQGQNSPRLQQFSAKICKVSKSYAPGLFHAYDIPNLPRINNDRESEFRRLRQRHLSTTGQVGATKRLLLRGDAWELIPGLPSLAETTAAISHVQHDQFLQERQRVRIHRAPFRLHTRSVQQSKRQLKKLVQRWKTLPASRDP